MTPSAPEPSNPNRPFTRDLLRTLTATTRAQPDETDAVAAAWAAFRPRDAVEQMLAAQIVGAHHAALDCLSRAMETKGVSQRNRVNGMKLPP